MNEELEALKRRVILLTEYIESTATLIPASRIVSFDEFISNYACPECFSRLSIEGTCRNCKDKEGE